MGLLWFCHFMADGTILSVVQVLKSTASFKISLPRLPQNPMAYHNWGVAFFSAWETPLRFFFLHFWAQIDETLETSQAPVGYVFDAECRSGHPVAGRRRRWGCSRSLAVDHIVLRKLALWKPWRVKWVFPVGLPLYRWIDYFKDPKQKWMIWGVPPFQKTSQ